MYPFHALRNGLGRDFWEHFLNERKRSRREVEGELSIADGVKESPEAYSDSGAREGTSQEAGERLARRKG